jgi:hypothetical protein
VELSDLELIRVLKSRKWDVKVGEKTWADHLCGFSTNFSQATYERVVAIAAWHIQVAGTEDVHHEYFRVSIWLGACLCLV